MALIEWQRWDEVPRASLARYGYTALGVSRAHQKSMTRFWHHNTADASAAAINSMLQIYNGPYKGTLPNMVSERRAARSTVVIQHLVLRACVATTVDGDAAKSRHSKVGSVPQ
jgi:hypothetical protein